ncbi:MAG: biotin/lipoyl-containing protein [Candidatus Izemoplasmatales bacterium]
MKLYKVKVNGKVYEVELESVTESNAKIESPKPAPAADAAGAQVVAPMQGQIVKVNVEVGTMVKKGAILAVLEAMKLENEILSPVEGVLRQAAVAKGQSVAAGQLLFVVG